MARRERSNWQGETRLCKTYVAARVLESHRLLPRARRISLRRRRILRSEIGRAKEILRRQDL
jgi:hypothetical protein